MKRKTSKNHPKRKQNKRKQNKRTQSPSALTPGRLLRIDQFIPDVIPISKSGWWDGVKRGVYPKPIKLSARVTVWESDALIALINERREAR